jgi:transposase-like protein
MGADDPDPGLSLNCPKCGATLVFLPTKPDLGVCLYACQQHGLFMVTPDTPQPIRLRIRDDSGLDPNRYEPPEADVVIEGSFEDYEPVCPICQQEDVEHRPTKVIWQRQFICATCGARWVVHARQA